MHIRLPVYALVSAIVALPLLAAMTTSATAETTQCIPITKAPTVISRPGHYCFKRDLRYTPISGTAIDVRVGNVVLDMNGYYLRGNVSTDNLAFGIRVRNKPNVRITNGVLVQFGVGLAAVGSSGLLVENMSVVQAKDIGISFERTTASIIRNSRFLNNFDIDVVENDFDPFADRVNKEVILLRNTDGSRIVNNDISNTGKFAASNNVPRSIHAIYTRAPGAGTVTIERNRIINTEGIAIGIQDSSRATVSDNVINNARDHGLIVSGDGVTIARDNTFLDASFYRGGGEFDGGGNVVR